MSNDVISEVYQGLRWSTQEQEWTRERIHWLCSQVRGETVLDMGCSQGIVSILLAREGMQVLGVDLRTEAIERAILDLTSEPKIVTERVKFLVADAITLDLPDSSFDSIVLGEILEHQSQPERLLESAKRLLKDDGRVVISVPFGYLPDPDHKQTYYLTKLIELLAASYLRIESLEILNKYICCVVTQSSYRRLEGATPNLTDPHHLLRISESGFLHAERRYLQTQENTQAQVKLLSQTRDELGDELAKSKKRNQVLSEQLEAAENQSKQAMATVASINLDLDAAKQKIREIDGNRQSLEKTLSQAQSEYAHISEERANLGVALKVSEKKIETAALEVRALQQKSRLVDDQIEHLKAEKATLQSHLQEARHQLQMTRQQLQSSQQQLRIRQKSLDDSWKEIEKLRGEVRYKLGDAVVSAFYEPRQLLHLPANVTSLFLEGFAKLRARKVRTQKKQKKRISEVPNLILAAPIEAPPPAAKPLPQAATSCLDAEGTEIRHQNDQLPGRLRDYLLRVTADRSSDQFVLMFSGTIQIQEKRANRPIRLTQSLLKRNLPVLFSYFRWRPNEPIPPDTHPQLFQSPIDKTMQLMREISRFDFKGRKKTFVLSFPYPAACNFLNEFNAHGWTTYYDVRDDWEEFHKVGMANWYERPAEIYAVNNCDVVSTVSRPLQQKMGTFAEGKAIHLCPNAYDREFLKSGELGTRLASKGTPILGYFGHLTDRWFDWDFLVSLAQRRPDWTIELIGHGMPDGIHLPENIRYRGFLGHAEICDIARRWSCALIPFKIGKLADGVDPIKVYEYLALGLPTVSLTMPQIQDYPYVSLAASLEEFEAAVQSAIQTETDPNRIRDWLLRNTWDDRVAQILALANGLIDRQALKSLASRGNLR